MNRKSLLKRIRTTKTGKILRRSAGISHNRLKQTHSALGSKKKDKIADKKIMSYLK